LEAAQNIDNRYFDENHVYFARILLEQGQTYLDKKSIDVAQEHLKESLHIYDIQPNRNVKQHSDAAEALGQVYLESGRSRDAFELFEKAMVIRMAIYGSSHPVIAETLYKQAQVLLKMAKTGENQDAKAKARQKLEQAQIMLGQRDDDYAGVVSEIEFTLTNL
jgi:tetratricopeptide (TPR) repeat protein